MSRFIPVEPEKWAEMVKAQAMVKDLHRERVHDLAALAMKNEEIEELKALDKQHLMELKLLKTAGDRLSVAVLSTLLKMGHGNKRLIDAYDAWRDVSVGKPNFKRKSDAR